MSFRHRRVGVLSCRPTPAPFDQDLRTRMTGSWVHLSPVWLVAGPAAMAEVRDQMIVPTALPINAVIAIATAPHTVTRSRLCPADAGADDAARRRGTGGRQRPA